MFGSTNLKASGLKHFLSAKVFFVLSLRNHAASASFWPGYNERFLTKAEALDEIRFIMGGPLLQAPVIIKTKVLEERHPHDARITQAPKTLHSLLRKKIEDYCIKVTYDHNNKESSGIKIGDPDLVWGSDLDIDQDGQLYTKGFFRRAYTDNDRDSQEDMKYMKHFEGSKTFLVIPTKISQSEEGNDFLIQVRYVNKERPEFEGRLPGSRVFRLNVQQIRSLAEHKILQLTNGRIEQIGLGNLHNRLRVSFNKGSWKWLDAGNKDLKWTFSNAGIKDIYSGVRASRTKENLCKLKDLQKVGYAAPELLEVVWKLRNGATDFIRLACNGIREFRTNLRTNRQEVLIHPNARKARWFDVGTCDFKWIENNIDGTPLKRRLLNTIMS